MRGGFEAVQLLRSGENYLKTILILQKQNAAVRSMDVANHLHFSRASVYPSERRKGNEARL